MAARRRRGVHRRQRAEQGLWRIGRVQTPYAVALRQRSRSADRGEGRRRRARFPPFRGISQYVDSHRHQRARRRIGVAPARPGASAGDDGDRQLRRADPLDHRHPVIDQCGIPNPVFAVRNGTIGWTLAGLDLDRGAGRRFPKLSPAARAAAQSRASALSERAGVRAVSRDTVEAWRREPRGFTLFLLDVRNPGEFEAGHLPGFRSAPGGQLVQATDEWVGVRHAHLVLVDDDGVRATLAASWLIQMGWRNVHVLDGGITGGDLEIGPRPPRRPPFPATDVLLLAPEALAAELDETDVMDLATSPRHTAGHVPGAWFVVRARLAEALPRLPAGRRLVLTSCDGTLARYAAAGLTDRPVAVLAGGTRAWEAAGLPIERGLLRAADEVDDVYKRPYEGTDNAATAMQAYLDWEFGLVEQLARDGTHGFQVF